jgi:hypothetical protein
MTKMYEGKGFPEGTVTGNVVKVQRLESGSNKENLFSKDYPEKIVVAKDFMAIDGQSMRIMALLLLKETREKMPKAIILERGNQELLNGLIGAQSSDPSIKLPLYAWDLNTAFFEKVKDGDALKLEIKGPRAIVSMIEDKPCQKRKAKPGKHDMSEGDYLKLAKEVCRIIGIQVTHENLQFLTAELSKASSTPYMSTTEKKIRLLLEEIVRGIRERKSLEILKKLATELKSLHEFSRDWD